MGAFGFGEVVPDKSNCGICCGCAIKDVPGDL